VILRYFKYKGDIRGHNPILGKYAWSGCNPIIEGSLEVKLPTIWTDEQKNREEKSRREKIREEKV
jgi:hypothetical protein